MSNVDELVSSFEVSLEQAQKREMKARAERKLIMETARAEARPNLTPEETERYDALLAAGEKAKEDANGIKDQLARATAIQAEEREADAKSREIRKTSAPKPKYDEVVRVGAEERTYRADNDPNGSAFLRDVVMSTFYREPNAMDNLARHSKEERVERGIYSERVAGDLVTGTSGAGLGGIVVPQYLVDMVAPATANLRPFADACTGHALPAQGMTFTIPRVTTATQVQLQASQLSASTPVSLNETDLTIAVKTAEGHQNVSRQAIERGSGVGDLVLSDLFRQYATVLDNELVNGATTGIKAVGIGSNTYTDASPDGPKTYTRIMGAASGVEVALKGVAIPDLVLMHGRRWFWLQGQMVSVWPMIGGGWSQPNAGVKNGAGYGAALRGQLPNGFGVVVDDNIVTNLGAGTDQDQMYVTASAECHLWEQPGQPAFIRAEQPNATSLGILLVVYGYFAYTFGRYANSVQTIDGTGLKAPAGF